jgi:hypothetical protein
MRYLCLIYENEKNWATLPKEQSDALMADYGAFTQGIKDSGHYIGGEALQPTPSATTLRVRNGKVSATDGPFAETKEQLGGFCLLECESLEEALGWAKKVPMGAGAIEVRAVMDLSPYGYESSTPGPVKA